MGPELLSPPPLQEGSRKRLVWAAGLGDAITVKKMLKQGQNVDERYPPPLGFVGGGWTGVVALNDKAGDVEILRYFPAEQQYSCTDYTRTGLQAAVDGGHDRVIEILIEAGADVDAPAAEYGETALQAASGGGHLTSVTLLIKAGATVNTLPTRGGRTALQAAAQGGHLKLVELLITYGADINAPAADGPGFTALQAACWSGSIDIAQLLLAKGADANAPPGISSGKTAWESAALGGHVHLGPLLKRYGVDEHHVGQQYVDRLEDLQDSAQDALLVSAAWDGDCAQMKRLLENGANHAAYSRHPTSSVDTSRSTVLAESSPGAITSAPFVTPMQAAAKKGHKAVVQLLLDHGADVNAPASPEYGRTVLQAAAEGGYIELVKFLLNVDVQVNAQPAAKYGRTALQAAAESRHEEVLHLLIEAGASESERNLTLDDKLVSAALNGDQAEVTQHLENGADPNTYCLPPLGNLTGTTLASTFYWSEDFGYYARTALQAASAFGDVMLVEKLLQRGSLPNTPASEKFGRTALQAAAENGHDDVVTLLLAAGVDVNEATAQHFGKTTFQAAAEGCHEEILKLLVKRKVDVTRRNSDGGTILHEACRRGNIHELYLLYNITRNGINSVDLSGSTPLHIAVQNTHIPIIRFLISQNADIELKDKMNATPLHVAISQRAGNIVQLLLEKGAFPDGLEVEKLSSLYWLHGHPRSSGELIGNNNHDSVLILSRHGLHEHGGNHCDDGDHCDDRKHRNNYPLDRYYRDNYDPYDGPPTTHTLKNRLLPCTMEVQNFAEILSKNPSQTIFLLSPRAQVHHADSFINPYLYLTGCTHSTNLPGQNLVEWVWLEFDGKGAELPRLERGIPTRWSSNSKL